MDTSVHWGVRQRNTNDSFLVRDTNLNVIAIVPDHDTALHIVTLHNAWVDHPLDRDQKRATA